MYVCMYVCMYSKTGASLVAQLVINLHASRRPLCNSWVRKFPWRRDRLSTPVLLGFPGGSDSKKNPPAMQETWVQSLGWEDPLEKEIATYSSIRAWNPMDRGAWWVTVHEVAKSQT